MGNCQGLLNSWDSTRDRSSQVGPPRSRKYQPSTRRLDQGAKLFPLSASISAIHHWMPVWSRKTVSAQCSPHLRISGSCPGFFGVVMLSGSTAHTCAPCGLPAVSEPPALVSLVRACGGGSFPAPPGAFVPASLPLRRYVRRRRRWYLAPWALFAAFPRRPCVEITQEQLACQEQVVKKRCQKTNSAL